MARKIEVQVVGDTRSIESAFRRTSKAGSNLERDLVRIGKKAAFAVGALGVAAGGVSVKLIKMAGDAEEVRSKFQVTFQQEMPRMVKQLDAFSTATGASRYQLRQQAADLGALLVPLIGSRKEAGNLSVSFTKLATDLSSFNNVPVDEALQAIRAGLVGEAEPLRRFGVLLNEAAVKAEAYRSGIAKSGAVLTETQKVQARANLIMQQTTLAQGDATRTSGSFTNQLRKFQNQVTDTATALGTKLLPFATSVLTKLNEWGPALASQVQPRLDALSKWASDNRQQFSDLFKTIRADAIEAGKAIGGIAVGADKTAKAMGGWDQAFQLILTGVLASKFAKVGKSLTGAGGMLPVLTKLKALGPTIAIAVVIDLAINEEHRKKLGEWAKLLSSKIGLDDPRWLPVLGIFGSKPRQRQAGSAGVGSLPGLLGGGAKTTAQGTQLPTSFKSTHQTSGLAGFPAVDIFATAGTPVLAPENGRIVSIRPFNSDPDFYGMAVYYLGASGATYYIKHIYDPSPLGAYKKGDKLGRVAQGTTGGPHVHLGKRSGPGIPIPVTNAPAGKSAGGGGVGGGSGGGAAGKPPATTVQPLIPAGLRLNLTKSEGTKNLGDDLTALRAMVAYLQKLLPKTKDIEKRIEITEALNGLRQRIAELGKQGKKADISDAIDYEALKKKLRDQFRDGIEQARQKIVDARAGFSAAFGILSDQLLSVFDAKTQKMLDNLRVEVQEFGSVFSVGAGEESPTERVIRERSEARTDAALANARKNAKTTQEIRDADEALEDRRLEKQARKEREFIDDSLAEQRRTIEAERAEKRNGFTKALAELEANWARTNATTAKRTADLTALMAKFDMPFNEVGALLGTSFADGFLDSMQIVFDRLAELARELNKITPAQAAEAVILAGGTALAARSAALNAKYGLGSLPHFQRGGIVPGSGAQLAVVHGGETVLPRGMGMGGVTVNVYGDVTGTELIEKVRREINLVNKQNGRVGYV